MPESTEYDFTIFKDKAVVLLELKGTITLAVLIQAAEAIYSHPDYDASFSTISEQLRAKIEISSTDLFHYISRLSSDPRRLQGDTVFVAEDPVNYGMGRMYQNMSADEVPDNIYFAKTVDEAFAILANR
ncbi:MAG: hypothetical protein WDZ52_14695 [Pseudohongiellaceae bacterium]